MLHTAMRDIHYTIRTSERSRRLRISITPNSDVIVTRPRRISERTARQFVRTHDAWIQRALKKVQARQAALLRAPVPWKGTRAEFQQHKTSARLLVLQRIRHFNQLYQFSYRSIVIRNQRTRWGSCSRARRLNFNYRLVFLPPELADYVIVHELCHLQEMNHSRRFWMLVATALPHYAALRRQLHQRYPLHG